MALPRRYKDLFANIGWISLSKLSSDILVFLLVPFYTRMLTTEEYGMYDMCHTFVVLMMPILTSNVAEALMRYALAERENVKDSFSCAVVISVAAVVVSGVVAALLYVLPTPARDLGWAILLTWLMLTIDIFRKLFSQFTRGIDRLGLMAAGSITNAATLVVFSVVFLMPLHMGVNGYFLAQILSSVCGASLMCIGCKGWTYLQKPTLTQAKRLCGYGMPLCLNSLAWWANSFLGRYFVTFFWSLSLEGILAAAYKIPSIPKVLQNIFMQAWHISAIKEFGSKDSPQFFSQVYNGLCAASTLLTSGTILLMPILKVIMFSESYYDAINYVPILMFGVVFNGLASVITGVYAAVGDSKPMAQAAFMSLGVTIVASIVLVPPFGAYGAAVCSVLASFTLWISRLGHSRRYLKFEIKWRQNIACLALLSIQIAVQFALGECLVNTVFQFAACVVALAILVKTIGARRLRGLVSNIGRKK